MTNHEYDIVLLGATGFTGRLIAEYLLQHAPGENRSVGFAGRSPEKGRALLSKLKSKYPNQTIPQWELVDINDQASLDNITQRAALLMNAAGPFAVYGPMVVEACVKNGCHYIDITGEPAFFHASIRNFHQPASDKGVCLIHACGFDSIPADLGSLVAVSELRDKSELTVRAYIQTNAQFSGGTWTTAILAIDRHRNSQKRPSIEKRKKTRKIPLKIHFHPELKRWAIPMPVLDPHVVKRSAGLLAEVYGPSFAYGQFITVASFWSMVKLITSVAMMFLLIRFDWGKNWLLKKNPSGTGPSEARRAKSRFEVQLFANSKTENTHVVVRGLDPGYNETAKMFSQSAFCLLDKLNSNSLPFGVVTTSFALGTDLVERLQRNDIAINLAKR